MKVTRIVESGTNNILNWAIRNNANVKNNIPLASLINDELVYLVTIEGVNFYELFRLSQVYRTNLRICNIDRVGMPSSGDLEVAFPGKTETVRKTIEASNGLVAQMTADEDIIPREAIRLFMPMITSKFTIQIPWSFIDLISVISEDDAKQLFTADYYTQLEKVLDVSPNIGYSILNAIVKSSQNIRYNPKYEKLVKITKYSMLRDYPNRLFKLGIVGFSKFNTITRGEIRCNMFEADQRAFTENMKLMGRSTSPLMVDIVIQLPIFHMQILESSYFNEDVRISYRSSINNILDNSMTYDNFLATDDEESITRIDNYKVRISETNLSNLSTIKELAEEGSEADPVSMFALLPPIYRANAVLTIDSDKIAELAKHSDLVISDAFTEIEKLVEHIKNDIANVG